MKILEVLNIFIQDNISNNIVSLKYIDIYGFWMLKNILYQWVIIIWVFLAYKPLYVIDIRYLFFCITTPSSEKMF